MPVRSALRAIGLLSLLFLALQVVYANRFPVIMDEFDFAYSIQRLGQKVPYRDFAPYKTVLGEYVQAPVLWTAPDLWSGIVRVKMLNAVLAVALLSLISLSLTSMYRPDAVVAGLALLYSMSTFSERASELRVDMLTALVGLAGLLFLMRGRFFWTGVLAATSFFVSQKGIYYWIATEVALAVVLLVRRGDRESWAAIVRVHLGGALVFGAYFGFWSLVASPANVFHPTMISPARQAFGGLYPNIRWVYWKQTLERNPMFYLLAGLALIQITRTSDDLRKRDWRVLALPYGLVVALLGAWHQQPWPYFFVIVIPTFFVLVVITLDWWLGRDWRPGTRLACIAIVSATGLILPLMRLNTTLRRDNAYQRTTIEVASALLAPSDTYLAGVSILYDRPQAVDDLSHMGYAVAQEISARSDTEQRRLIRKMEQVPLKLLIMNYRVAALPGTIQIYLRDHYAQFFGSVHLYAPVVRTNEVVVRFPGRYRISSNHTVVIDGVSLQPGTEIVLDRSTHSTDGVPFRLLLLPQLPAIEVDARQQQESAFFPNVYRF